MSTGHHGTSWRVAAAGLLIASGCRSSPTQPSAPEPTLIHVGAGSPQAIAQRSVVALVDDPRLADACERWDARYLVRFDESEPAGVGTLGRYRSMVRSALLASGRFLVTEQDAAPVIVVGIRGPLGDERADVLVRGSQGAVLVRVSGSVTGPL